MAVRRTKRELNAEPPFDMRFNAAQLDQLFPFHLVVDGSGRIRRCGNRLTRLLTAERLVGQNVLEAFTMLEPRRTNRWAADSLIKRVVVLRKNDHVLHLKGEVIWLPERGVSLFASAPWITSCADLKRLNLQVQDFPVHQGVTDFLFMLNAQENHAKDAHNLAQRLREQRDALAFREHLLGSLLANMPEGGALVVRQDGRVLLAGGMDLPCRRLTDLGEGGASLADLFGIRGPDLWTKIKDFREADTGQRFLFEDGKNVYRCTVTFLPEVDCSFSRWLVIFQNINEDLLHQAREERMERLDSVGVLAGGIAHDFNNYLTSIIGNITLAREMPELTKEALENAEEACRNAQQLTRQLLTFAKGGDPIKETGDLVLAVQKAAKFSLSGSKIKLHFVSKVPEAITQFDSGQISQVINNLCVNASQAMHEEGKVTIRITAHRVRRKQDLLAPGPYARIVVQDNGPGIPADILPRIWDAYFTTKATGSGLGLATCHSIIRRHQGSISVTSSPGKGTRFTILIPLLAAESHASICQVDQETTLRPSRILVMDDQAPIRMVSKRMMEKLGHEVVAVENGPDAVAVFRDAMRIGQPFHLAVLDMTIPGSISGQETLRLLREIDPSVYAVICSGYSEYAPYVSPEGGGFNSFLSKPFTFTQVRELLNECGRCPALAA